MALPMNLLLLSVSLICVVESAPAVTESHLMGLSVAERDAILDRTNSCTPFLRRPDGSPMDDDMATYYEKKKCPIDNFFLMIFDTRRGHDMLDHLIVQRKKVASVCHGFIALLSLIDAYQLTDDMCADRVLVSEARSFCDHQRRAASEAVVQMFKQLRYESLQAVADLLSNLDNEPECSKVCGGVVDSALCNSFMDAAKFFIDEVPLVLEHGTARVDLPAWVHSVHTGGAKPPTPSSTTTTFGQEQRNDDHAGRGPKQGGGGTEDQGNGDDGGNGPVVEHTSALPVLSQVIPGDGGAAALERGTTRVDLPAWVHSVHTGGTKPPTPSSTTMTSGQEQRNDDQAGRGPKQGGDGTKEQGNGDGGGNGSKQGGGGTEDQGNGDDGGNGSKQGGGGSEEQTNDDHAGRGSRQGGGGSEDRGNGDDGGMGSKRGGGLEDQGNGDGGGMGSKQGGGSEDQGNGDDGGIGLNQGGGGTEEQESVNTAPSSGIRNRPKASTPSPLASLLQRNGVSQEEIDSITDSNNKTQTIRLLMKLLQQRRNHTIQMDKVSPGNDDLHMEITPAFSPQSLVSKTPVVEHTPARPVLSQVIPGDGGAAADDEAEEIDKSLKQIKDNSREETVQPLLPTSERVVDDGDTTPPKTVSNGDGDGDREDFENMDPDLSKENVEDADRTHDGEWNNGWRGNEFNNDKKNRFGNILQSIGKVQEDHGSEERKWWSCSTWHFFTVTLLIVAGVLYIAFRAEAPSSPTQ